MTYGCEAQPYACPRQTDGLRTACTSAAHDPPYVLNYHDQVQLVQPYLDMVQLHANGAI